MRDCRTIRKCDGTGRISEKTALARASHTSPRIPNQPWGRVAATEEHKPCRTGSADIHGVELF